VKQKGKEVEIQRKRMGEIEESIGRNRLLVKKVTISEV